MTPKHVYTQEEIREDPMVQDFFFKKQIEPETVKNYMKILVKFCDVIKEPLNDYIAKLEIEQRDRIKNDMIIKYNPNKGTLNHDFNRFVIEHRKMGVKETSISTYMSNLRTFFSTNEIKLPKRIKFKNDADEWYVLKKHMIKNAIDLGNVVEKPLYSLTASKGDRKEDIWKLQIKDFIKATFKYHECTELDDFLAKAPKNMIGYWEHTPLKTKRYGLKAQNCNSPESSNYLLAYLKFRKARIDLLNKKYGYDYRLKKTDKLFAPYRQYSEGYSKTAFDVMFSRMNTRLYEIEINDLENQLKAEKISPETYDEELLKIPKFTPHALRKYNSTMLQDNGVNIRVSERMLGHKDPADMDKHYIKLNEETIREGFNLALEDVSFQDTELHHIKTVEYAEMENKVQNLEETIQKKEEEDKKRDENLNENIRMLREIDPVVLQDLLKNR